PASSSQISRSTCVRSRESKGWCQRSCHEASLCPDYTEKENVKHYRRWLSPLRHSLRSQEDTMETRRCLLPFTHGVNMQAIDYAVSLAGSSGATLVAVSLVSVPQAPRPRGARLEHIQQSKDFLEAVKWKATR